MFVIVEILLRIKNKKLLLLDRSLIVLFFSHFFAIFWSFFAIFGRFFCCPKAYCYVLVFFRWPPWKFICRRPCTCLTLLLLFGVHY